MRTIVAIVVLAGATLLCGCPAENFDNTLSGTLEEIDRIVDDADLDPNEKRIELASLGLSAEVINALLKDELFANQYGGDPRTAYNKVVGNRLNDLTPDEVQIYAGDASNLDDEDDISVNINDQQAQAIVDFFEEFGISSADELEVFLDTSGNAVPDTIPDGALRTLFVDFDPTLLLPGLP